MWKILKFILWPPSFKKQQVPVHISMGGLPKMEAALEAPSEDLCNI